MDFGLIFDLLYRFQYSVYEFYNNYQNLICYGVLFYVRIANIQMLFLNESFLFSTTIISERTMLRRN